MENSLVCQSNGSVSINFSGYTISSGETWVYLNNSDTYSARRVCVSVIDGTDDVSSPYSAYTQYNSCYECEVDNYTFYVFTTCDTDENYFFPISEFGEDFYNTGFTIDSVFYIEFEYQGGIIKSCGLITEVRRVSEEKNNGIINEGLYSTLISYSDYYIVENPCDTCLESVHMKRSAGVESIICNTCDDVESVTATTVPHAIYTTLNGVAILQINTVALGGFNGLNN